MKTLIDLKLVQLDDGVLQAIIQHEGIPEVFHHTFEDVDSACADLHMILKILPTQGWFRKLVR